MANLEPELGNLRAALDWSIESKQFNAGAAFLGALGHFLYILGLRSETSAPVRAAAVLRAERSRPGRGVVLGIQLFVLPGPAFYSATRRRIDCPRAGHGQRRLGRPGLGGIGFVQMRAQPEAAVATYEEAIPLARATGQRSEVVMGWCRKAYALVELGRFKGHLAFDQNGLV